MNQDKPNYEEEAGLNQSCDRTADKELVSFVPGALATEECQSNSTTADERHTAENSVQVAEVCHSLYIIIIDRVV